MDLSDFRWTHESAVRREDGWLVLTAPANTDFFCDPAGAATNLNAPFLHRSVTGDFTFRARVRHPFRTVYDACVLMVWDNPDTWAKVCFEGTDFGTRAAVSVVTKGGVSDDANGPDLTADEVWLQICRRGRIFSCQYSPDGVGWHMTRFFALDAGGTVEVGLVAQSPAGPGSEMSFSNVELLPYAPKDMRAGV